MATLPTFLWGAPSPASVDPSQVSTYKGKGRAASPLPVTPPPAAPFVTITGATDRGGHPIVTLHASLMPAAGTPSSASLAASVAAALAPLAPSVRVVVALVTHGAGRPSSATGRELASLLSAAHVAPSRVQSVYVLGADFSWRAAAATASWVVGGDVRAAWTSIEYVDLVEDLEAALGSGVGEVMGLTWEEVVADEEYRVWLGRHFTGAKAALDPCAPLMRLNDVQLTATAASEPTDRRCVADFV